MNKNRTIICGDIHGCLEEFQELINKLKYNPIYDRMILLGDLIDRGEHSLAVVQKARKMRLECVMGNHEYKFLKWYNIHKFKTKFYDKKDYYTQFTKEDIDYISKMPNYIKLGNTIMVHAGLKSEISVEQQTQEDLLYLRYTDHNKQFISLKKIHKIGKEAANAHFWTEFWKGPESIVYGHNVHSFDYPLIEEVSPNIFCYGLDTGCCFGGNLSCLILETKEIVQVKAKKIYYQSNF